MGGRPHVRASRNPLLSATANRLKSVDRSKKTKMGLPEFADEFVSLTVSDVDRRRVLDELVALVSAGPASMADVVQQLGPALTHVNTVVRARGVLLLASLLQRIPVERLNEEQLGFLLVFLRDRSRDGPCVPEVLMGMTAIVSRWAGLPHVLKAESVEAMLVTLFAEVFTQGLDQVTRLAAYQLIEAMLSCVPQAAIALRHDFVYGYLQMIDGERDPRNLLVVFGLTVRVVAMVPGWERLAEDLFDVTACYYPINYKPRNENDPITPKMLSDALDAALTCCSAFSEYYYAFMTEKLEGEHTHLWASLARSIHAFGDGGKSFLPHAAVFWNALQTDAFEGKDAETVQGACVAVTGLISALSENLVTQNNNECTLDPLLQPLLLVAAAKLQAVDSKDALVAGALLSAAARGSAEAARRVCAAALPALMILLQRQTAVASKEKVASILCDLVSSAVSVGAQLMKKSHPLAPHAEGLQGGAFSLYEEHLLRERGLALLSDLCFRTPLASLETQTTVFGLVLSHGADATLAAVAGMTAELQASLAVPELLKKCPSDAALAGLCALRPSVTLPDGGESLCASLLDMAQSPLAAAVLGNLANKGQVSINVVEGWLSRPLSAVLLAWLGRGLVMSSSVLVGRVLAMVAEKCAQDNEMTALLETLFASGLSALSAGSSHAKELPLGRQKAFCLLFPALVERSNLRAVGILAQVVSPAVLLGELEPLLPLLLVTIKEGRNDNGALEGALLALGAVAKGKWSRKDARAF